MTSNITINEAGNVTVFSQTWDATPYTRPVMNGVEYVDVPCLGGLFFVVSYMLYLIEVV
ncbi:MAG: hypothetical protein HDS71_04010 [Bacteroidales bacterium]|nr:hypothetical protein [Bacteroidales bacterium]